MKKILFVFCTLLVLSVATLSAQDDAEAAAMAASALVSPLPIPSIEPEARDAWVIKKNRFISHVLPDDPATGKPGEYTTGKVEAQYDYTTTRDKVNTVFAFTNKKSTSYQALQAIVHFQGSYPGDLYRIDVRNNDQYTCETEIVYKAGIIYHFRVVIDLDEQSYSVWVTPSNTNKEVQIAKDYRFRLEAGPLTKLKYIITNSELIGEPAYVQNLKVSQLK